MSVAVVLNPNAGSAQEATIFGDVEVLRTEAPGDATRLAKELAERGVGRVVAAGGDGTVAEVVQGLMAASKRPELGVLPLGTGNDLARTLGMSLKPEEALAQVTSEDARIVAADVLEVTSEKDRAWALNCVNGGVAHAVRGCLDSERKAALGPLAFGVAAVEAAGTIEPREIVLQVDDGDPMTIPFTFSLVAANGPTVGGGYRVAPGAEIDSGAIELVMVRGERLVDLLGVALRTGVTGDPYESELVHHARCQRVKVHVPDGFGFTVDGEGFEGSEVEVVLHPGALRVVRT